MDPRKRLDEYRNELERARKAKTRSDILDQYTPKDVSLSEIVKQCLERSIALRKKYGPQERKKLDLACYFNFTEPHEEFSAFETPADHDFRSLSIVSNSFQLVLYARDDAPSFLKSKVGKVLDLRGQTLAGA